MAYTTIDDPSQYFQTATYAGNGSTQSITNNGNSNLQPDWIWFKNRTNSPRDHVLIDSSRGVDLSLYSNQNKDDQSLTDVISSFDSDGFSLESNVRANESSQNHVAWQWAANGGTTASNSDGGISSTVQVNSTAGFSIILYTGNSDGGSTSTSVGHGLGDTPDWIIYKRRSGGTRDWIVFHQSTGSKGMILNSTSAGDTASSIFGGNLPTSTTIPVGYATETNTNGESHIAYAFAEKQGYSKFGSYTGNGNADGPFVYTGFKPAWLLVKRTDSTGDWSLYDSKIGAGNPINGRIEPNNNDVEVTGDNNFDFLSNGFKGRDTPSQINASSGTYIYMAFAESSFVSSKGVPTTAR